MPTIIDGRYEVRRRIGSGGFATVSECWDSWLRRTVAIKELVGTGNNVGEDTLREARLISKLDTHPNIVRVLDVSGPESPDLPFIVLEYVPRTLQTFLDDKKYVISEQQVTQWTKQICRGLDYAHKNDILHQDLTPRNILVDNEGRVKITDFGLSRIKGEPRREETRKVGSPKYISPERAKGRVGTAKSDQFAAAAICYALLTRDDLPSERVSCADVFKYKDSPCIPEHLEKAIITASEWDPDNRYADVRDFEEAMDAEQGTMALPDLSVTAKLRHVGPRKCSYTQDGLPRGDSDIGELYISRHALMGRDSELPEEIRVDYYFSDDPSRLMQNVLSSGEALSSYLGMWVGETKNTYKYSTRAADRSLGFSQLDREQDIDIYYLQKRAFENYQPETYCNDEVDPPQFALLKMTEF